MQLTVRSENTFNHVGRNATHRHANQAQMVKYLLLIAALIVLSGCTSTYKINYSAMTSNPRGFSVEDVENISEFLTTKKNKTSTGTPNHIYLSQHKHAWEILKIGNVDTEINLSVTRLTKYLGNFSENWKANFKRTYTRIIEQVTGKTAEIRQI